MGLLKRNKISYLVVAIMLYAQDVRGQQPDPVQNWLSIGCEVGQENEASIQLAQLGTAAVPTLISAAQTGPDTSLIADRQASASAAYDTIQLVLAAGGPDGMDPGDVTAAQAITRDAFVAQELSAFVLSYRTRALEGLGIIGGTAGIQALLQFANDTSSPELQVVASEVLSRLDTIPPVTSAVVSPQPNPNGWNNSNVTILLNSTDNEPNGTGVKQITYSATGAQSIASTVVNGASASFTINTEGITTVSFLGADNAGNLEPTKSLTIQLDKTPPTIACSASPNLLWPPNNKLVAVNLSVTVSDALSGPAGFTLVSVTSNEPDSGQGDIQGFLTGTASTSGQLRAQRLGSGTGRVYTFTYSGADKAGNTASCTATVTVPHDQGH